MRVRCKAQPRKSRNNQACVNFRKKPARIGNSSATWVFTKPELADILKHWNREVAWGQYSTGPESPFRTAIVRNKAAAPVREELKHDKPQKACRRLYHGVGKDQQGLKSMGRGGCEAVGYDKYSPNEADQKKPQGQFSEVFSIFTLNVIPESEAKEVVQELHDKLRADGRAVIATRRDICKLDGCSLLPSWNKVK
jgi:hypothetical protein